MHSRVPYTAMEANIESFIQAEYRPPGLVFKDPRNMHQMDIMKLLMLWFGWQEEDGPESVFRFQLVVGPNRMLVDAVYPGSQDRPSPKVRKRRTRKKEARHDGGSLGTKRTRKGKGKGKERQLPELDGLISMPQLQAQSPPVIPGCGSGNRLISSAAPGVGFDELVDPANVPMVLVDMGDMQRLNNMGYKPFGPVNGPNEGPPEYLVPKKWMEVLQRRGPTLDTADIANERRPAAQLNPNIDPLLQELTTTACPGPSSIPD